MPNAFVTGIAQNQTASTKDPNSALWNPNTPWANAISVGTAAPGAKNGSVNGYYDDGHQMFVQDGVNYIQPHQDEVLRNAQQYFANQFRNNIPQTENNLYNQFGGQVNQSMNQGIRNVRQQNSNRGLLYGGINAGQEQGVRAQASGQLAQGRSSINNEVENAANTMDQSAINTGIGIQQQQQQMQNAIYQNALAKMNANNMATSGLLGAVGMGAGMYLGAGTPTGAVAGGLLGSQIGRTL